MSFDWRTPLSGKDAESKGNYPLLPEGIYTFQVEDAKGVSDSGAKPYINLKLRAEGDKDVFVFDKLFLTDAAKWRIAQFAKCVGIFYEGITPYDVVTRCIKAIGTAKITVREYTDRYGEKKKTNDVKEYIVKEADQPEYLPF